MAKPAKAQNKLALETVSLKQAALIYRAIYHPVRLQIIDFIHGSKSLNVSKIIEKVKLEQAIVSQQLKILRDVRILNAEKKGLNVFYTVNYEQINAITTISRELAVLPKYKPDTSVKRTVKDVQVKKQPRGGQVFTEREE